MSTKTLRRPAELPTFLSVKHTPALALCRGGAHRACQRAREAGAVAGQAVVVVHVRRGAGERGLLDIQLDLTPSPWRLTRRGVERAHVSFRCAVIAGWVAPHGFACATPTQVEWTRVRPAVAQAVADDLIALLYVPETATLRAGAGAGRADIRP